MNIRSRRTICKIPSNWSGRQPGVIGRRARLAAGAGDGDGRRSL